MTSSEYAVVFELLDGYSRRTHRCFLAEFDLSKEKTKYHACFRPTGGTKDSPNRYACRYLKIQLTEVAEAVDKKKLPGSLIELLDRELPSLGQLI